ncbi:hypothetical protein LCGC14_1069900 [marine sediment metagenome]|uniref:DNA polymerase III beta sliding clamp central domain-containing protein n=1 Tax=marine sediment metagenome TaxID=412755 RepID=A0A0F9Q1J9_9ZZZZ
MKLRILSENLMAAVTEAVRAIAKRSSLPQGDCVLLETVDGHLRVTGTDLETAISVYSGAQVEKEGRALIKAGMLARILGTFTDCAIDIEPDGKHGLALSSDGRAFKLAGMDPEDYPPIPETPEHLADIDPLGLRRALARLLDCVSTDDTRPILTAVNFAEHNGTLALAATDGFRLGVVDTGWTVLPSFPDMNVPAKTCRELLRLLPKKAKDADAGDPVQLHVDAKAKPTQLRFALKRQEVTTMLVQGTFPNYRQLIPATFDTSVKVDTKALRRELQAAAVLASQGSNIVRLTIGPGDELTVAALAEEEGEFEATMPAKVEGEGKIAFNWAYVDDFLSAAGTDAIELRMTTPSALGLFLPVGDDSYSQTIMPMFVQW